MLILLVLSPSRHPGTPMVPVTIIPLPIHSSSVSAQITESHVRSSFSTYNDEVDLCAPGSSVLSTVPGDGYAYYSGTSMASPHAAGVAALIWSQYPKLSHEALINILETTATDLPLGAPDGYDNEYGHGLVNAEAAYEAVLVSIVPTVSSAPSLSSAPSNTPSLSSAPRSTPSDFCSTGIAATVEVRTDGFEYGISWDIKDADGVVIASRNYFPSPNILFEDRVCLTDTETCDGGTDYTFTIYDDYGDGICCKWGYGYYKVIVEGEIYAEGGEFYFSESTSLCAPTPSPSNVPSISSAPSSTPSDFCPTGFSATVEIYTDFYPEQTSWEIKDTDGVIVASRDSFQGKFELYEDNMCLAETETCSGTDYIFTIYDSAGDGICCARMYPSYYKVIVEGETYVKGDKADGVFEYNDSTSLCHTPCYAYGSENECNEVDMRNCYWNSKHGECRDCSDISNSIQPRFHKRKYNFYGCTWNGNSCE